MTPLKQRICRLIAAQGPISVSEYMATCLFDPEAGYYTTREPFGSEGDFVTAPEISQMFGELLAVWLYEAWLALGRPLPLTLAEIGPGRGTLMQDMLRIFIRLDPAFVAGTSFAMIETSPRLVALQKEALADVPATISWHEGVATLPDQPLLIVGNELFDAVPLRQFVLTQQGWRERMIGLDDHGRLGFFAGAASLDASLLPPGAADAPQGAIVEISPARSALMQAIASRISRYGGAGLFIDYGYLEPGIGDTFQALRRHRYEDVLENPGDADLTAHVDFAALGKTAHGCGLDARFMTQGAFLLAMGLLERAGRLGANKGATERDNISAAVERLAGPQAMGDLFKVMAVTPVGLALPPFSAAN